MTKAFLVIPDHHVFEDYYIAVTEQYRRLAEQHHNLLLHFYLALASGPDYESAKTLVHDFLTAIITETTEAATDVVLYIARDVYNSLPPHYRDNPNVIWEFGFREGKGKPCILLKDRTVNAERYYMPFDIADFRLIDIPEDENEQTNDDDYGSYIRKIREFIEWQNEPIDQTDQCTYWHAGLTLQFGGGHVKMLKNWETLRISLICPLSITSFFGKISFLIFWPACLKHRRALLRRSKWS